MQVDPCPHAAHNAEIARLEAALGQALAERDRARAELAQYRRCLEAVAHFWRNDPLAFGDESTSGTLAVRFAEIAQLCCDALEAAP
jgi:hypothetical protein